MNTLVGKDIETAIKWLLQDEVIAIPTETVYGLAGNALQESALLKIFKAKNRPYFNPLIIHTKDWESIHQYVLAVPEDADRLAAIFSPGPITFLLPRNQFIPDLVTSGSDKVAIRIPAHPITLQLLQQLPFPLAAPSANIFGYVSPTKVSHVVAGLEGIIPMILDGGDCKIGLESTIVDFENDQVLIRRIGGLSVEKIESVLGKKVQMRISPNDHPVAPGMLKSHYATLTTLLYGDLSILLEKHKDKKVALIEFGQPLHANVFWRINLSVQANLDEAAATLFAAMRQADNSGAAIILAQVLPAQGLGLAINDRLTKAAHQL